MLVISLIFLIILINLFISTATLLPRYEDDMVIVGNYNGYVKCAEAFLRLGLSHKVSNNEQNNSNNWESLA